MEHLETEGIIEVKDGTALFRRDWIPAGNTPDAICILVHGLGEHSGRYGELGAHMAAENILLCTFDHRGHGKSPGRRAVIRNMDDSASDVATMVSAVEAEHPGLPVFVLGHSMGGLITTLFSLDNPGRVRGILLSAPALKIDDDISPFLQRAVGVLAAVVPALPTLVLDATMMSRDPEMVRKYHEDPLNYRSGIPAATGHAMNRAIKRVRKDEGDFHYPVYITFGEGDKLVDPAGSRQFYSAISSEDKTMVPLPGLYHEIFNEPERGTIMKSCSDWIRERIS